MIHNVATGGPGKGRIYTVFDSTEENWWGCLLILVITKLLEMCSIPKLVWLHNPKAGPVIPSIRLACHLVCILPISTVLVGISYTTLVYGWLRGNYK